MYRSIISFPSDSELEGASLQYAGWSSVGHQLVSIMRTLPRVIQTEVLALHVCHAVRHIMYICAAADIRRMLSFAVLNRTACLYKKAFDLLQVFVHDNNVYHQASPNSETVRLTNTGQELSFFNGVPDWLYEGTPFCTRIRHRRPMYS